MEYYLENEEDLPVSFLDSQILLRLLEDKEKVKPRYTECPMIYWLVLLMFWTRLTISLRFLISWGNTRKYWINQKCSGNNQKTLKNL